MKLRQHIRTVESLLDGASLPSAAWSAATNVQHVIGAALRDVGRDAAGARVRHDHHTIIMDPNAVLGPVDPQLGGFPARGIVELLERKDIDKVSDEMLIMAGMATRALHQVRHSITSLLLSNGVEPEKAER